MKQVALIGYGGMGQWHCENIVRVPGLQMKGVYDINPDKIELAKSRGLVGYPTAEALLRDAEIDLVVVATPNNFHQYYCLAAVEAGKNVITEKPAMMNAAELEVVIAKAKQCNKLFTVHQNRRWDGDFLTVKEVLQSGVIGKPYFIDSRVQGSRGIPGDWRCVKEAGGGMLLDWGVHLLDQLLWMIDSPVREVYAQMLSIRFPEVDDNIKVLLQFENGVCAQVQVDTNCFIAYPRWHVSAKDGTMVIQDWDISGYIEKANEVAFNWEEGIIYTASGRTRTMAPRPVHTIERLPLPKVTADWCEFYRNIADVLDNRAELIVKPEQVLRVMRVIDACFQSSKTGHSVRLQDSI